MTNLATSVLGSNAVLQGSVPPRWKPAGNAKTHCHRVPVVLQMTAVECGAACLAMILGFFGRRTRLEECRARCDPGRDGITAQTIVAAARDFGLRTKAYCLTAEELQHLSMPAIIHWNFNHFVVLEHWSERGVGIVDPGWGRREIAPQDFEASFSGVALAFEPDEGFEKRVEAGSQLSLGYINRILGVPGTRRLLVQILTASLLLQVFGFAVPAFTKLVVDRILPGRALSDLNVLGMGAFLIALVHASMGYLRSALLISLAERLDWNLMSGFF